MSNKIGHFEILSELSKSATCIVYKANDEGTSQTVALKAIQLSAFGEHATELQQCLLEEAETAKVLSHPNLTPVLSAAEIDLTTRELSATEGALVRSRSSPP